MKTRCMPEIKILRFQQDLEGLGHSVCRWVFPIINNEIFVKSYYNSGLILHILKREKPCEVSRALKYAK